MENSINLMKYKIWYLIFSAVILVPGIIFLALFGLRLSIDFTGGSDFIYQYTNAFNDKDITSVFQNNNVTVDVIRKDGDQLLIRTTPVESSKIDPIKNAIAQKFNQPKLLSFETVGPTIGRETTKNAFIALFWASIGILFYIAYAFRNIPKPYSSFRFGASAIIAMLHDAFVVLGIFAILSYFFKIEIDALFITAVLTVIGFSVHDTIVVFDRIRENLSKLPANWGFESIVNYSVVETLNRSVATSLTVIMTLLALFLLGGESIKEFVLAMLIGIVSGTYSSIFNASPILVLWEQYVIRHRKK
jgi:preprotein translocase subunit SecF